MPRYVEVMWLTAIALAGLFLIVQALLAAVARRAWTLATRGRILQGLGAITWVRPDLFVPGAARSVDEAFGTAGLALITAGVASSLWHRRQIARGAREASGGYPLLRSLSTPGVLALWDRANEEVPRPGRRFRRRVPAPLGKSPG